jgi:hypothetical protein
MTISLLIRPQGETLECASLLALSCSKFASGRPKRQQAVALQMNLREIRALYFYFARLATNSCGPPGPRPPPPPCPPPPPGPPPGIPPSIVRVNLISSPEILPL